jgi:hypothetical protein
MLTAKFNQNKKIAAIVQAKSATRAADKRRSSDTRYGLRQMPCLGAAHKKGSMI